MLGKLLVLLYPGEQRCARVGGYILVMAGDYQVMLNNWSNAAVCCSRRT